MSKWHVASINLRKLIFEVEHRLLWGFLLNGNLKKMAQLNFFKLS
jgi:hypothetical protein